MRIGIAGLGTIGRTLAQRLSVGWNQQVLVDNRPGGGSNVGFEVVAKAPADGYTLLMAQPPQAVTPDQVPPREYIFVLDVSGSMNGFPLDTAKTLMRTLVTVLKPTDTFNVVVFADGSQTFSRSSMPAPAPSR